MRILRVTQTLERTGYTRSPLYNDSASGLFTRPVKISGGRASGWPEHEVEAIVSARVAGVGDEEVRKLVHRLHDARKALVRGL